MARIAVRTGPRAYEVEVGRGLLSSVGRTLGAMLPTGPALVVTDENVAPLYLQTVLTGLSEAGFAPGAVTIPAGEPAKSLSGVTELYSALLGIGADRGTPVVALGGGVVGDIAGFAAATFLRGLPWVVVPTSLLAQVDASVGGKTGVNLPEGKNLVGAVHQPSAVVSDLDALRTLAPRQLRSGLAEVAKTALALDPDLLAALEADPAAFRDAEPDALERAVSACARAKAQVVERDEHEGGLRRVLNFGHTAGHALEAAAGYGELLHGEAVAVGLVTAARISCRRGLLTDEWPERIARLLRALGLPAYLEDLPSSFDLDAVGSYLKRDKKRRGGNVALVLLREAGRPVIAEDGTAKEVLSALTGR